MCLSGRRRRQSVGGSQVGRSRAGRQALRIRPSVRCLETLGENALPKLADYAAWMLASSQFSLKNYGAVPKVLETVWKQTPSSPLTAKASILAAQAYEQNGMPRDAVEILRKNYALLPQPQGDLALATAFAAAGDAVSAAIYNQRVYYGFPASAEAASAEAQLAALRAQLGDNYPPSLPNAMLSRALKLLEGGQTQRAKKELETLVPQLGGTDRDMARVSIGVADYNAKETDAAHRYLTSLETSSADADAERLYYLLLSARQLKNEDEVNGCLDSLARLYPNSPWRLQALVATANHYLVQNFRWTRTNPCSESATRLFPKTRRPRCATGKWCGATI